MSDKWKKVPKIDLHRHLEGCIRYSTVRELSADLQGLSEEEAHEKAIITSPSQGLAKVFETFWISQRILSSTEVIERITFEACEDAALDGIVILELRYQPSFIQIDHPHLSFADIHQAVVAGVKRAEEKYPTLCVGLIGIIGRNLSIEIAKETTDFMIANKDTFVGADLANVEIGNCCVPFAEYFRQLKQAGLGITIHQGEEGDPEKVRDAIEQLGADRIGHGIQIAKSQETLKFVVDKGTPLEISATSNYIVGVIDSLDNHPVNILRDAGVNVTINTDDPVILGEYTLSSEYAMLEEKHQWTLEDFKRANAVSFAASFIPIERKSKYWSPEAFVL